MKLLTWTNALLFFSVFTLSAETAWSRPDCGDALRFRLSRTRFHGLLHGSFFAPHSHQPLTIENPPRILGALRFLLSRRPDLAQRVPIATASNGVSYARLPGEAFSDASDGGHRWLTYFPERMTEDDIWEAVQQVLRSVPERTISTETETRVLGTFVWRGERIRMGIVLSPQGRVITFYPTWEQPGMEPLTQLPFDYVEYPATDSTTRELPLWRGLRDFRAACPAVFRDSSASTREILPARASELQRYGWQAERAEIDAIIHYVTDPRIARAPWLTQRTLFSQFRADALASAEERSGPWYTQNLALHRITALDHQLREALVILSAYDATRDEAEGSHLAAETGLQLLDQYRLGPRREGLIQATRLFADVARIAFRSSRGEDFNRFLRHAIESPAAAAVFENPDLPALMESALTRHRSDGFEDRQSWRLFFPRYVRYQLQAIFDILEQVTVVTDHLVIPPSEARIAPYYERAERMIRLAQVYFLHTQQIHDAHRFAQLHHFSARLYARLAAQAGTPVHPDAWYEMNQGARIDLESEMPIVYDRRRLAINPWDGLTTD